LVVNMEDKDPLEMMLTECVEEIGLLKHNFLNVTARIPHLSVLLTAQQKVAHKLLEGYRSKTIDEDIIIAALEGVLHNVGRIRSQLEGIRDQLGTEKKLRADQTDKYIG